LRCAIARRRRTDILRSREVHIQPFEIVGGQHQILRAGFGVDLEAPPSRPLNLLHRLAPGDMHDHDRNADQFRMRDCAVGRLALDESGPGLGMKVRMGLAVALEAIGHVFDLIVAFRVNHHRRALFARDSEHSSNCRSVRTILS
jgi:hypothetical protein